MRRIVHALAVAGLTALAACSDGGSVLSTGGGGVDRTIVSVQGTTNLARVLPGSSIALSATTVRGANNGSVPTNRFTWSAATTSGLFYNFTTDGNQQRPCQNVTITSGGTTSTYIADMALYITIDPTNESNIIFSPPAVFPAPAGSTVTANLPYCVNVSATPIGGGSGNTGSLLVVVVNPANPLQ